jgi:hypothetical protein
MQGGQRMVSVRNIAGLIALVGLVLGLASVTDASQHKKSQPRGEREVTGRVGKPEMVLQGTVASVDPRVGFIVLRHGAGSRAEDIPVEIDSKTTLMRGGQRASIDTVKPGDRVKVMYTGSPGDVSKRVELAPGTAMRTGSKKQMKTS